MSSEQQYFHRSLPDDSVPTETSVQQMDAEEACQDAFFEFAGPNGLLDREACVLPIHLKRSPRPSGLAMLISPHDPTPDYFFFCAPACDLLQGTI